MKLSKIIAIADAAYPDGLVKQAYLQLTKSPKEPTNVGDTLAEFITRELKDTYDETATDDVQLEEASRIMGAALRELGGVQSAFDEQLSKRGS